MAKDHIIKLKITQKGKTSYFNFCSNNQHLCKINQPKASEQDEEHGVNVNRQSVTPSQIRNDFFLNPIEHEAL